MESGKRITRKAGRARIKVWLIGGKVRVSDEA